MTCQDCHRGKVQGKPSGYERGPAAIIGVDKVPTKPRKLTNHYFAGPDYPIIHPGIFPHNVEAAKMATLAEWLQFDYRAGWGTDAFEDSVSENHPFPERWRAIDDRYDARDILNEQFKRLAWAHERRLEVLRNGFQVGEIVTGQADRDGIRFKVEVKNLTEGHNVPTGFIGERLVFLEVTVRDREGAVIFKSGDRDPNGDLRDAHSLYVHNGELPLDDQLFNLQSRFLTRNLRGGEREQVLAINYSTDPLPFIRPSTRSTVLTGQPAAVRIHRKGIEPLGSRWGTYEIDGDALTGKGPYKATIRLIVQSVPVNLIDAIKGVGFDYSMSAREVADAVVAGADVLEEKTLAFDIP